MTSIPFSDRSWARSPAGYPCRRAAAISEARAAITCFFDNTFGWWRGRELNMLRRASTSCHSTTRLRRRDSFRPGDGSRLHKLTFRTPRAGQGQQHALVLLHRGETQIGAAALGRRIDGEGRLLTIACIRESRHPTLDRIQVRAAQTVVRVRRSAGIRQNEPRPLARFEIDDPHSMP